MAKISFTAVVVGGTVVVLATSTALISSQFLNSSPDKDDVLEKSILNAGLIDEPSLDGNKNDSFKDHFKTRQVNRAGGEGTLKPIMPIVKGGCFDSFFPGVDLITPTNLVINAKNPSKDSSIPQTIVPAGWDFSGEKKPVGCKMMKFSEAKNGAGFGYMSETTVHNEKFGIAFYAAVTNTKKQNATGLEYWLLLMSKGESGWTLLNSYYWLLYLSVSDGSGNLKQHGFSASTPDKQAWQWSPKNETETFKKFFDNTTDTSSLWLDQDKYYVGFWVANDGSGSDYIFYDGSNERWGLNKWLNPNNTTTAGQPIPFLTEAKLTQKGKWKNLKDECNDVKGKDLSTLTTHEISKCIKEKVLASSSRS